MNNNDTNDKAIGVNQWREWETGVPTDLTFGNFGVKDEIRI